VVDTRVSLKIYDHRSRIIDQYCNFQHAMFIRSQYLWDNNGKLHENYSRHRIKVFEQGLELFGGTITWFLDNDTVWFSDAESRTWFILTWS